MATREGYSHDFLKGHLPKIEKQIPKKSKAMKDKLELVDMKFVPNGRILTENGSRNIPNTMCGLVGTFLISAKMFLIPCVLWAISGTISNMFLIPK